MCLSAPSPPDTSAADAEARRQEEADRAREEAERRERTEREEAQREQERIDREAWEAEQRALQEEQQRQQEEAGIRLREQQEAERVAAEQQANRVSEYQSARSAREADLRSQIDGAFSGYDDAFFSGFESDYLAHHNPVIAQNANEAKRAATLALAENGNLQSSAATRRFGLLDEQLASEQARIAQEASDAAATYRSNILAQRRALLDQALSSTILGDPNLIPADASVAISALDQRVSDFAPQISSAAQVDRPSFGTVGNAFLDVGTTATAAPAASATGGEQASFAEELKPGATSGSLSLVADPTAESKAAAAKKTAAKPALYGVTAA